MLREYAKEAGQSASQLDAEIRPSMAHKVHQNFAKNICGVVSLSFISIFLSLSLAFFVYECLRLGVGLCMYFKSHLACSDSGILKEAK